MPCFPFSDMHFRLFPCHRTIKRLLFVNREARCLCFRLATNQEHSSSSSEGRSPLFRQRQLLFAPTDATRRPSAPLISSSSRPPRTLNPPEAFSRRLEQQRKVEDVCTCVFLHLVSSFCYRSMSMKRSIFFPCPSLLVLVQLVQEIQCYVSKPTRWSSEATVIFHLRITIRCLLVGFLGYFWLFLYIFFKYISFFLQF